MAARLLVFALFVTGACADEANPFDVGDPGTFDEAAPTCDDLCCDPCHPVGVCTTSQMEYDQCTVTCSESGIVGSSGLPCLAQVLLEASEAGCESTVAAYREFDIEQCESFESRAF